MSDPIKAALREAALANLPNAKAAGDEPSRVELKRTAAAVAAFLRAVPTGTTFGQQPGWHYEGWIGRDMAAAVERAAREDGDG